MTARRQSVAAVCALILSGAVTSTGCAIRRPPELVTAAPESDWMAVQRLAPGRSVRLVMKDGAELAGNFVSATADGVVVRRQDRDHTSIRSDVELLAVRHRAAKRKAAIGALGAGIAGAVVGAATPETSRVVWSAGLGLGWAAIGALIGASDGYFDRTDTVIYRAE